jgi:NADH:ubiquinone oxidoreductase subunit 4 (subunit M)
MQFVELAAWIAALKANYALGADGISIALIVLTAFTTCSSSSARGVDRTKSRSTWRRCSRSKAC